MAKGAIGLKAARQTLISAHQAMFIAKVRK
jgi:hypothetical protein